MVDCWIVTGALLFSTAEREQYSNEFNNHYGCGTVR
jgi:hypothetical protein